MIDTNAFALTSAFQTSATKRGLDAYRRELLLGKLSRLLAWMIGRRNELESLDGARLKNHGAQHEAGLQSVPIGQIRGTEGRSRDFDRAFRPLNDNTQQRWLSIYNAQADGVALPAVELICVGQDYYVRDGHHRISVARMLGQRFVDARVIVMQ